MSMFFGNDDWVSLPSDPWESLGLFDRDDWEDPPAKPVNAYGQTNRTTERIDALEARIKSLEARLAKIPSSDGKGIKA